MKSIDAAEFDRRVDAGADVLDSCEVISEKEMLRNLEMSKTPGKLESYLAKLAGKRAGR